MLQFFAGRAAAQSLALPAIASGSSPAAPTLAVGPVALDLPAIASTATLAAPTVSTIDLLDGLLAWWELGEASGTRADSHGTADLAPVNAPGSGTGKVGDAVSLNGTTQYLTRSPLSLGTTYTFGAWVNLATIAGPRGILSQRSTTANPPISGQINVFDGQVRWNVRDDANTLIQATIDGVGAGAWHFLVGVRDGGTLTAYLDGVAGTPASGTLGTITPNVLDLGANALGSTTRSNLAAGLIDQAFVYGRALSPTEIEALFNSDAGRAYAEIPGAPQALALPAIASTATLAAPTIGAVTIGVPAISSGAALHAPTAVAAGALALPAISSGAALHAPAVSAGPVTLALPAIASGSTLAAPTLASQPGPLTAKPATAPIHGFATFASAIDAGVYHGTGQDTGDVALEASSSATAARQMRLVASADMLGDVSYRQYEIRDYEMGRCVASPVGDQTVLSTPIDGWGRAAVRLRLRIDQEAGSAAIPTGAVVPICGFFRDDGSPGQLAWGIVQKTASGWVVGVLDPETSSSSVGTTGFATGDDVVITYRFTVDETPRLAAHLGANATPEATGANSRDFDVNRLRFGAFFNAASSGLAESTSYGLRVELASASWRLGGGAGADGSYYGSPTFSNVGDPDEFAGSGIRASKPGQVRAVYLHRAGQWRDDDYWRVAYSTDDTFATGTSFTAWKATAGIDPDTLADFVDIAGLDPNTTYYYKFQLSGDGSTVHHDDGETRRFLTLPDPGDDDDVRLHVWSCIRFRQGVLADPFGVLVDDWESTGPFPHKSICLGDFAYDQYKENSPNDRPYTAAMTVTRLMGTFCEPNVARLNRAAVLQCHPSDHDIMTDNGEASGLPGGANEDVLANDWWDAGGGFPPTLTVGEHFAATRAGYDAILGAHPVAYWEDNPGGYAGYMRYGKYMECFADVRWWARHISQDGGTEIVADPVFFGADQVAWLSGTVAALAASDPDVQTLLLASEKGWTPVNHPTADDPYPTAPDEIKSVHDAVAGVLDGRGVGVVTLGGDRHCVFAVDRYFLASASVRGDAHRLNIVSSACGSNTVFGGLDGEEDYGNYGPVSSTYMVAFFDWANHPSWAFVAGWQNPVAKNSGVVIDLNTAARTLDLEYWIQQADHTAPALVQPAALQGFDLSRPLAPPSLTSGAALHGPTLAPGPVTLALPAIASTATLAAPTIGAGAATLALPAIASGSSPAAPTLAPGAVGLDLPAIASGATLAAPGLAVGAVTLAMPAIASGATLHDPIVSTGGLTTPAIPSGAALYGPTLAPGAVTLVMPTIAGGTTLDAPSVGAPSQALTLPAIASTATLAAPAVTLGSATIELPAIPSGAALHGPTLGTGSVALGVPVIASGSAAHAPTAELLATGTGPQVDSASVDAEGTTLTIRFDRLVFTADPAAGWTVEADAVGVPILSAELAGDSRSIALSLGQTVLAGQDVTLSYSPA